MKKSYIFILALAFILLAVSGQQGCELPESESGSDSESEIECQLSLCDCECHLKGQTPEELQGVLCGINCYGLHNITGCEYVNETCQVVYLNESDISSQQKNSSNPGPTGSAQDNPMPEPKSKSGCSC